MLTAKYLEQASCTKLTLNRQTVHVDMKQSSDNILAIISQPSLDGHWTVVQNQSIGNLAYSVIERKLFDSEKYIKKYHMLIQNSYQPNSRK